MTNNQRKVHARTICDDGSDCAGPINKAGHLMMTAGTKPVVKTMAEACKVSQ